MKKNEVKKLVSVRVYFTDLELLERIKNISNSLDVSLSAVSGMILRSGIDQVETMAKNMRGEKDDKKKSK